MCLLRKLARLDYCKNHEGITRLRNKWQQIMIAAPIVCKTDEKKKVDTREEIDRSEHARALHPDARESIRSFFRGISSLTFS